MAAHSRPLLKLLSEPRPAKKIRRRQGLTIARRTSSKRVGIVAAVSPPPGRPLDDEDIVATTLDRGVRSATAARHKFSPRITVRWQRNGSCPSCGETDETPWVPLGVEAVVPTAYRQALGTRASTNLNLPQLASRRCAVRAPRTRVRSFALAAMSPSPGRVAYGGGDAAATERRLRSAIRR